MKIIKGSELQFLPASHEDPKAPGVFKKVLAVREDLFEGRVQMINWAKLPAGASFRRHLHEDMEEVFVLTQGTARVVVDGVSAQLSGGDTLIVSPNEVHEMTNVAAEDVLYVVVGIAGGKSGRTVVVD